MSMTNDNTPATTNASTSGNTNAAPLAVDSTQKVLDALSNGRFKQRTAKGVARETSLDEATVTSILTANSNYVRRAYGRRSSKNYFAPIGRGFSSQENRVIQSAVERSLSGVRVAAETAARDAARSVFEGLTASIVATVTANLNGGSGGSGGNAPSSTPSGAALGMEDEA